MPSLVHHELCFGCGQSNLFGLLLDVQRTEDGAVAGRWFVKQDHQGPSRAQAHPGIVACALVEAITLAGGEELTPTGLRFDLELGTAVPVGSFCEVEASVRREQDGAAVGQATASRDGRSVAQLTCAFVRTAAG